MSSIYDDNLLRTLPQILKNDRSFHAFAAVVAKQLRDVIDDIDCVTIYARIDSLPEPILDILAYDFKVDWWDYNYSLEEKRQTLKDSWMVHRHLGTKFSVEKALSAIYPKTTVSEWFEYDGDPYMFRLNINVTGKIVHPKQHNRVLELVDYYKNLRSHLDGIEYTLEAKEPATLHTGGHICSIITLALPIIQDEFNFTGCAHFGGHMSTVATIPIPATKDNIAFVSSARIGGQSAIISTTPLAEL